ncbi:dipeptidyl peptidase 3, partial [Salmonella enterica]|uniref:dipeptidyl peptidase 3 n=1 Tax=Salmonella enterica TaxID=28901 RepID=UPI0020C3B80A
QQEAEDFYEAMRDENDPMPISYGLNSTLRKTADGMLKEDVWHEGGLYGDAIKHIAYWLEKAAEVAENELQAKIIGMLVDYYRTGDL